MPERSKPEIPDLEAARSREEEKEIHDMSLDPHVREAELHVAEHAEALKRSEAGVGSDIDGLLDEYNAALRELRAKPDDKELLKRRDAVRARLEKSGMFRSRLESSLPTVLTQAQEEGSKRFERAKRAREDLVQAREARVEERLMKEQAQAFFEFHEMFGEAMLQVERNIKRLPSATRGQFRSLMSEIWQRKEHYMNELIREGVDFTLLSRDPTALDSYSWDDFVSRMQQFSTEMIELNNDIREELRGRQKP